MDNSSQSHRSQSSCASGHSHYQPPTDAYNPPHYMQADGLNHQYSPADYAYYQNPDVWPDAPAAGVRSWFDFSNTRYLKGFVVGAAATLLLTNSNVQKALVRTTVKLWSAVQGGVEEVKEQFQDIKAEMSQEK